MIHKYKIFIYFLLFAFLFTNTGCKKFVDVGAPETSTNAENVYASDATAIAVLSGLYTNISRLWGFSQGDRGISMLSGLSADDFSLMSGADATLTRYYSNSLLVTATIASGTEYWSPLYDAIYTCNSAIEGLVASNSLTPLVKKQLLGEAMFIRAFMYFYLVNFFGDVPLVVTTDHKINATMPRTPQIQVYNQIIQDLKEAVDLLSAEYLDKNLIPYTAGSEERVRPTKWAAAALLARAYLYNGNLTGDAGNYANAETQASIVISSSLFNIPLPALNSVFLKNSAEAIWQLQPVNTEFNTEDAKTFIITSTGLNSTNPVCLSNFLLNAFESGDQRKTSGNWVNSIVVGGDTLYYPYKYKVNLNNPSITSATGTTNMTEYLMVLRLGEQYLLRAEAKAQQNKISEAQSDLNAVRIRAGLLPTTANYKNSLLSAILRERQVELFTEWGHRWLDLKRTNTVDAVMSIVTPQKSSLGSPWKSYQQLYPLPYRELQTNPALLQNQGY
ncbi:MAG: RagB/SusD family nutrient uptake outer membrane protein [Chitinophagaceae bacterium]